MDCSICCEKFNKSTHLKIDCRGCVGIDVSWACRTCCQTYITTNTSEASCMFCKSAWDREFCNENLTKKWVGNEYKIHMENILVEHQISLLPSTQPYALRRKRQTDLYQQISMAKEEVSRLQRLMNDQYDTIKAYNLEIARINNGTTTDTTHTETSFSHKCPSDTCNGFLDSKFTCGTCEMHMCKDCMEEKKPGHVCNEELKMTVKAILKQSKPCPGCGEIISKIDGCDQMWCVKCKTQFSWRTGATLSGNNHNPEYFRYLRETGQTIAPTPGGRIEMVCGVEITDRTVYDIIVAVFPETKFCNSQPRTAPIITLFTGMFRMYRHIQWDIQRNDRYAEQFCEVDLRNARVDFLLNKTVKSEWKRLIQKVNKKRSRDIAYINIWRLAETMFGSLIERIVSLYAPHRVAALTVLCGSRVEAVGKMRNDFIEVALQIMKCKEYINTQFLKTLKVYGSTSCPGISHTWREAANYKGYISQQNTEDDTARNKGESLPRTYTDEWCLDCLKNDFTKLMHAS